MNFMDIKTGEEVKRLAAASDSKTGHSCLENVSGDVRCGCGSMLAILKSNGLELKCRKCKRIVLISFPRGTKLTVAGF